MTEQKRKPNEPHDQFVKQFVPVVLKNLFESQTSVSVQLSEELAIDVLCIAIMIQKAWWYFEFNSQKHISIEGVRGGIMFYDIPKNEMDFPNYNSN